MKQIITLAGGCFWGIQALFDRVPGVLKTTVGYANGKQKFVTYPEVCQGTTGFAEAVQVVFDDQKISLANLLKIFFQSINPTSRYRQGYDVGTQYRTGVYYRPTDAQTFLPIIKRSVEEEQTRHHQPIVTEIEPLKNYVLAETYHQKYFDKNPQASCHFQKFKEKD